jgi:hypothetical protein
MLSTLDISAVDVRLETPIDEADTRVGGVSQIVGHRPLSRSIPFQLPSWSVLELPGKAISSFTRRALLLGTYLVGPRTVRCPL